MVCFVRNINQFEFFFIYGFKNCSNSNNISMCAKDVLSKVSHLTQLPMFSSQLLSQDDKRLFKYQATFNKI